MNIVVFDTETTGIPRWDLPADDPSQPHIVDIGGILCDETGKEIERFESIVKPDGWTVGDGAATVHGITTEIALAQGRPIIEVLDGFDALLARAGLLVAFNLRFDDKLLRGARRRNGRPDGFGTIPVFCCMRGATPLCKIPPTPRMRKAGFEKFKTPNLGEAVKMLLNREHVGAHRAMADAVATKDLYFALRCNPEFMAAGSDFKTNVSQPKTAAQQGEDHSDSVRGVASSSTLEPAAATVPCKWCGISTPMTGTKMCDGCWELDHRIRGDMAIAKRIMEHYTNKAKEASTIF
ncbi:MAG: 3'-5' exonuclease [Sulfuritalea sp.]|nr:3'-5' exonuclease [Sulfuritalea sp.]